jgi:hypothetical protein
VIGVADWGELFLHNLLLFIEPLKYFDAPLMKKVIVLCFSDAGMKSL